MDTKIEEGKTNDISQGTNNNASSNVISNVPQSGISRSRRARANMAKKKEAINPEPVIVDVGVNVQNNDNNKPVDVVIKEESKTGTTNVEVGRGGAEKIEDNNTGSGTYVGKVVPIQNGPNVVKEIQVQSGPKGGEENKDGKIQPQNDNTTNKINTTNTTTIVIENDKQTGATGEKQTGPLETKLNKDKFIRESNINRKNKFIWKILISILVQFLVCALSGYLIGYKALNIGLYGDSQTIFMASVILFLMDGMIVIYVSNMLKRDAFKFGLLIFFTLVMSFMFGAAYGYFGYLGIILSVIPSVLSTIGLLAYALIVVSDFRSYIPYVIPLVVSAVSFGVIVAIDTSLLIVAIVSAGMSLVYSWYLIIGMTFTFYSIEMKSSDHFYGAMVIHYHLGLYIMKNVPAIRRMIGV